MPKPTFRDTTDLLCLSGRELADMFGVSVQRIKQARLEPDKDGCRPPPKGWEARLAPLAREKGGTLVKLAEELERA